MWKSLMVKECMRFWRIYRVDETLAVDVSLLNVNLIGKNIKFIFSFFFINGPTSVNHQ